MTNLQYRLNPKREVVLEALSDDDLSRLRAEALKKGPEGWSMRSCWNCNSAHVHFLEDTNDGFLFRCFDCGRIYFNGADITENGDGNDQG